MHELPLVIFTVLAQSVAASFILLQCLRIFHVDCAPVRNNKHYFVILCLLFSMLTISGLAALTHLGTPLRTFNVLLGLGHLSAMSLEVIMVSIFGAFFVAAIGLSWLKPDGFLFKLSNFFATVFAVFQILAIANVYALDTVYLWATPWTWINFIFSGFITGSVLLFLLLKITIHEDKVQSFSRPMWMTILIASVILSYWYILDLNNLLSIRDLYLPASIKWLLLTRIALIVTALTVCLAKAERITTRDYILASTSVILAEFLGRIAFYELSLINHL